MMRFTLVAIATFVALFSIICLPAQAHEGHNHGDATVEAAPNVASIPRAAASSDIFEVVAIARDGWLEIYIDRFATNEPVVNAVVEVETPEGPAKASVEPNQTYRLEAPWLSASNVMELVFTVTADGVTDILPLTLRMKPAGFEATVGRQGWLGEILPVGVALIMVAGIVAVARIFKPARGVAIFLLSFAAICMVGAPAIAHDGHDHGDAKPAVNVQTGDIAQRLADGRLFVPKAVQRIFGLRALLTETKPYRRRVELPGRIIPDPNASGFVQAAAGGRLSPPPNGFPRLGTIVKQGDILAYVTPPLQAIDISDMRQRRGEIDQQIAIMQDRLARFQTLIPSGAIARSQV
ncbi:MAG: RND transporter, partial [Oxalobacteraceae bacterium]